MLLHCNKLMRVFKFNLLLMQLAMISPDDEQFDLLLHKLKERLDEGHGETIYEIGVGGNKQQIKKTYSVLYYNIIYYQGKGLECVTY